MHAPGLRVRDLDCGSLSRVSFHVTPGEVVCLSGPSGSGKSRLLRAIADLDAHGGEVFLGEQAQQATPAHVWRREVMLLPAEPVWWQQRVGDHFPRGPERPELEALGLPDDTAQWPVTRLSSGEKQRAALLRGLAHQPAALLLDEPTANLDGTTTKRVEAWLLERIAADRLPTLWVAHDPEQIARVANRHLRIAGARVEPAPCRS